MKISSLRFHPYTLPFVKPFRTARETLAARRGWVVWVEDGEGNRGVGEAAPLEGFGMETWERTGEVLRGWSESLPGTEIGQGQAAAPDTPPAFGLGGDAPGAPAARHGLELALLDLAARRAGLSLAAYLHPAAAGEVAVNAVLGAGPVADTVREAEARVAEGFRTLKLKVAADTAAEDEARLRAVREAVGAGVRLRIDGNGNWERAGAAALLERLAPLEIEYVEQPLPREDLTGMAALAARSPIPIAADEAVLSLEDAQAVLAHGAAQVLILKPMALGGVLTALQVARLAVASGVGVVVTTMLEGAYGRAGAAAAAAALHGILPGAARHRAHGLATGALLAKDLVEVPWGPEGGKLPLPAGPGLGYPVPPPPT